MAVYILNIMMAGIDYSLADIDTRSCFFFTQSAQSQLYERLKHEPNIKGAVILSTCNRTELYLSCTDEVEINPFELLCRLMGADINSFQCLHRVRRGDEVFWHLCRLACGVKSQIWGEDQIITQVKTAIAFARENQVTDHNLEVLFRTAVTAAKKIKTTVRFSNADRSVADKTLHVLNLHRTQIAPVRSVLVIGSGQVGRMVACELVKHGYSVAMTRRHHCAKSTDIPAGVNIRDYACRYEDLGDFEAVVSATNSPHHTLTYEAFVNLPVRPGLLIDLAVPRDIDKRIAELPGVSLKDIDSIAKAEVIADHTRQLMEIDAIIEKYNGEFTRWKQYRALVTV